MRLFLVGLSLALMSCSNDLQETVGPLVPVPNVTGLVTRDSVPVGDIKAKLIQTSTDSLIDSDRTDPDGRFGFAEVGAGDWTIEVKSSDPNDFASVTIDLVFTSSDTAYEAPVMELTLGGFSLTEPQAADSVPTPSFRSPLEFRWTQADRPNQTAQVRVHDELGDPFWYSDKINGESIRWNGLGNRGTHSGEFVTSGLFKWRVRVEQAGSPVEWTTEYQDVVFVEAGP